MRSGDYRKLKPLVEEIRRIRGVLAIILFGSYARGDAREGSDADLLVLLDKRKELDRGRERIAKLESRKKLFMQIVSLTPEEFKRSNLLDIVLREGKIFYSRVELRGLLSSRLEPFSLITYTTAKLDEKDRVVVAQRLEGRGKGRYKYRGLVQSLGGFKVGRGVLMVPSDKLNAINQYLTDRKVDYLVRNVWMVG